MEAITITRSTNDNAICSVVGCKSKSDLASLIVNADGRFNQNVLLCPTCAITAAGVAAPQATKKGKK